LPALAGKASKASDKLPSRVANKSVARGKPVIKKRQQLCCALCGAVAQVQRGEGVLPCISCGSKLFRAGQPR
jgi:ribosomal protein L37AE/L43A